MGYASLRACVADLERTGQLVRVEQEIDPHLEAAEAVHHRLQQPVAVRLGGDVGRHGQYLGPPAAE